MTLQELLAKTDPVGGCLVWRGRKYRKGYGFAVEHRKNVPAHRLAYRLANGAIPEGLWILHRCNNPSCINPEHLYAGTPTENARDRELSGNTARGDRNGQRLHPERTARGERVGRSKLTAEQVSAIKAALASGATQREAGAPFGATQVHVSKIALGKVWRHVA